MVAAQPTWLDDALRADPYPYYKALREAAPVAYDPHRRSWLLLRYRDVDAALHDDRRFTAEQGQGPPTSMLVADPPQHTRLRTLVSRAFTPRTVSGLRPRVQAIVDDLLDGLAARPTFDAIAEFAYPLPITVIAELLGVDPEERDFFRAQSEAIIHAIGPSADPYASGRADEARARLRAYFEELIARRRAEPRDDLVSALIAAETRGDLLGHAELLAMLMLLLIGGHETTVNLIGNGLLALLRHPDQLARLRTEDGIARTAVEELLRYDSPVHYTGRLARIDFELGGRQIRAGERVRMMLAAANRDPEVFADPDRLDLGRDPCPHLSFGAGVHFCLGAALARMEGEIALPAVVRRFPTLRLAATSLRWRPTAVMHGLTALPLAH